MLSEFSRGCYYGPVKIGAEGGAMVEVVADRHMTKGPKIIDLGDGKTIMVTVDIHDGYHAAGSVKGAGAFDLVKKASREIVINGTVVTVLHENRA